MVGCKIRTSQITASLSGLRIKKGLHVHHIVPFHVDPSKELDPTNLITLCGKYCHYTIGHLMDYKSWNPNVIEDCKIYSEKIKTRPYLLSIQNNNNLLLWCYNLLVNFFRSI